MYIPVPRFVRRKLFGYIYTSIGITFTLIQITQFAVYYGNLGSRATLNLFTNSSEFLQNVSINGTSIGWALSYLIACIILIGPLDYYTSLHGTEALDLIITILAIYFLAGYFIGRNVVGDYKRSKETRYGILLLKAFMMGIVAISVFNGLTYFLITQLSNYINSTREIEYTINVLQSIASTVVWGVYGESPDTLLIRGAIINGSAFGIFGMFWTAILLPNRSASRPELEIECDIESDICYIPVVESQIPEPNPMNHKE